MPERTTRLERPASPDRPIAAESAARPFHAVEPIPMPPQLSAPSPAVPAAPVEVDTLGASATAPPVAPPPVPRAPRPTPIAAGDEAAVDRGATAPQLRRFIKSRAYVPMHELRRRFAINGGDDEVTVLDLERQRLYVGLPEREGRLLGDLLRGGDIGYELSMDPITPIVVGVYPMRPVTRA
jgi:hypothetical protein